MIGDTDFFIDLMSPAREFHRRALAKAQALDNSGTPVRLSAVTRFELFSGSEQFHDPTAERSRIQDALEQFPTYPLSPAAADRAGLVHGALARNGRAIGLADALIAGVALHRDEPVLTRNVREFERVQGLKVETY